MRKRITRISYTLGVLVLSLNAMAGPYLIQAEQTSDSQYLARLKAGRKSKSFAERQFAEALSEASDVNLEKMFLNLQRKLKSNNSSAFINEYKNIYFLRHKHNWSDTHRNIIAKTIHILAGLELDPLRQKKLQNEAKSFSTPLKSGKMKLRLEDKLPHDVLSQFKFASINGQKTEFDQPIQLGSEPMRLQLFSSKWQTQTMIIEVDQLSSIKPHLNTLVSGSCELGFYPHKGFDITGNEQVVGQNCQLDLVMRPTNTTEAPSLTKSFEKKSFKVDKKWLFIGGAILGGLVLLNQKEDSSGPKRTSGF